LFPSKRRGAIFNKCRLSINAIGKGRVSKARCTARDRGLSPPPIPAPPAHYANIYREQLLQRDLRVEQRNREILRAGISQQQQQNSQLPPTSAQPRRPLTASAAAAFTDDDDDDDNRHDKTRK
jgi:hypothetical protein